MIAGRPDVSFRPVLLHGVDLKLVTLNPPHLGKLSLVGNIGRSESPSLA